MATEAERRRAKKYKSRAMRRVAIEFYPPDYDLYEYLQTKQKVATYIKELVRKDMYEGRSH